MSEIWSCFFRELRGRQERSERTMKERVTRDAGKKGVLEQKKKRIQVRVWRAETQACI